MSTTQLSLLVALLALLTVLSGVELARSKHWRRFPAPPPYSHYDPRQTAAAASASTGSSSWASAGGSSITGQMPPFGSVGQASSSEGKVISNRWSMMSNSIKSQAHKLSSFFHVGSAKDNHPVNFIAPPAYGDRQFMSTPDSTADVRPSKRLRKSKSSRGNQRFSTPSIHPTANPNLLYNEPHGQSDNGFNPFAAPKADLPYETSRQDYSLMPQPVEAVSERNNFPIHDTLSLKLRHPQAPSSDGKLSQKHQSTIPFENEIPRDSQEPSPRSGGGKLLERYPSRVDMNVIREVDQPTRERKRDGEYFQIEPEHLIPDDRDSQAVEYNHKPDEPQLIPNPYENEKGELEQNHPRIIPNPQETEKTELERDQPQIIPNPYKNERTELDEIIAKGDVGEKVLPPGEANFNQHQTEQIEPTKPNSKHFDEKDSRQTNQELTKEPETPPRSDEYPERKLDGDGSDLKSDDSSTNNSNEHNDLPEKNEQIAVDVDSRNQADEKRKSEYFGGDEVLDEQKHKEPELESEEKKPNNNNQRNGEKDNHRESNPNNNNQDAYSEDAMADDHKNPQNHQSNERGKDDSDNQNLKKKQPAKESDEEANDEHQSELESRLTGEGDSSSNESVLRRRKKEKPSPNKDSSGSDENLKDGESEQGNHPNDLVGEKPDTKDLPGNRADEEDEKKSPVEDQSDEKESKKDGYENNKNTPDENHDQPLDVLPRKIKQVEEANEEEKDENNKKSDPNSEAKPVDEEANEQRTIEEKPVEANVDKEKQSVGDESEKKASTREDIEEDSGEKKSKNKFEKEIKNEDQREKTESSESDSESRSRMREKEKERNKELEGIKKVIDIHEPKEEKQLDGSENDTKNLEAIPTDSGNESNQDKIKASVKSDERNTSPKDETNEKESVDSVATDKEENVDNDKEALEKEPLTKNNTEGSKGNLTNPNDVVKGEKLTPGGSPNIESEKEKGDNEDDDEAEEEGEDDASGPSIEEHANRLQQKNKSKKMENPLDHEDNFYLNELFNEENRVDQNDGETDVKKNTDNEPESSEKEKSNHEDQDKNGANEDNQKLNLDKSPSEKQNDHSSSAKKVDENSSKDTSITMKPNSQEESAPGMKEESVGEKNDDRDDETKKEKENKEREMKRKREKNRRKRRNRKERRIKQQSYDDEALDNKQDVDDTDESSRRESDKLHDEATNVTNDGFGNQKQRPVGDLKKDQSKSSDHKSHGKPGDYKVQQENSSPNKQTQVVGEKLSMKRGKKPGEGEKEEEDAGGLPSDRDSSRYSYLREGDELHPTDEEGVMKREHPEKYPVRGVRKDTSESDEQVEATPDEIKAELTDTPLPPMLDNKNLERVVERRFGNGKLNTNKNRVTKLNNGLSIDDKDWNPYRELLEKREGADEGGEVEGLSRKSGSPRGKSVLQEKSLPQARKIAKDGRIKELLAKAKSNRKLEHVPYKPSSPSS